MKSSLFLSVLMMAVALFSGCSTPDARIKRSPEVFASLTPEQQALVKEGKVAIGFSEDAVLLAVGEPSRKWSRTEAAGVSELWSYTTWENGYGHPLYQGFYHRYYAPSAFYYSDFPARREHEYFKVVFKDGRVVAIEQDSR